MAHAKKWAKSEAHITKTVQGDFEELREKHDISNFIATRELLWSAASAFFALPVIILLKTSSAIFYNVLNIIFGLQRRKWKKGLYNLLLEGLNEANFSQLGYGGRLMDEQEKKLQLPPYRFASHYLGIERRPTFFNEFVEDGSSKLSMDFSMV
ncbi:hypothetical protein Tco_0963166 [Tanacetum coccineum]